MEPAGIRNATSAPIVQAVATSTINASKRLTVALKGTAITALAARDLTVAVNDIVMMAKLPSGQWVAFARLFNAASTGDSDNSSQPPAPTPTVIYGTTTFSPVETRSYRSGGWRDDDSVRQGEYGSWGNHTGCAFYGKGPRGLSGATVDSAYIRAKRIEGGQFSSQSTTLHEVAEKTRPSGAPTLSGSASGPHLAVGSSSSKIAIPTSFAQDLVNGGAGGLAIYSGSGSPYCTFAGRSDWSQSFVLTIKWHRNS